VVRQETTGLLGCATKTRPKTRQGGVANPGRFNRPGGFNRLGGAVRPPGAGQISRAGLTAQGGGLTALATSVKILRSGGHASGSQGLRRG
jgi:hypothetical protein